jgi:hypothetical protein
MIWLFFSQAVFTGLLFSQPQNPQAEARAT